MITAKISATLDTNILEKIQQAIQLEATSAVQVGWFNTGVHPDSLTADKSSVAGVAFRNEFGVTPAANEFGVPERPFIRPTLLLTRSFQVGALKRIAKAAVTGKDTKGRKVALGVHIKKALQRTIDAKLFDGFERDNSKFIQSRKGRNHPLKGRTGTLRNSIKYRVVPTSDKR